MNQVCNAITNKILDSASENIPNKVTTCRPSDPPWRHNAVRKTIRHRKRLHTKKNPKSSGECARYRKAGITCVNKERKARQIYYLKLANQIT